MAGRHGAGLNMTDGARVLRLMAEEHRLRMLELLHARPCSVGEVATALHMAHSSASRQLGMLRSAGLVTAERDAQRVIYSLEPKVRCSGSEIQIDLGCCCLRLRRSA